MTSAFNELDMDDLTDREGSSRVSILSLSIIFSTINSFTISVDFFDEDYGEKYSSTNLFSVTKTSLN